MTKNAGVDRIAPVLLPLLDAAQPRPTRTMATQTWAAILPELPSLYELAPPPAAAATAAPWLRILADEDAAEFTALCAWSLPSILLGCYYDPARTKRSGTKKAAKVSLTKKAQLKGWSYVFYALRCVETLVEAAPMRFFPLLFEQDVLQQHHGASPSFIDYCVDHLLLHPHPWVHAVTLRILRCYFYTFVEEQAHFLANELTARHDAAQEEEKEKAGRSEAAAMPFVFAGFAAESRPGRDVHKALLQRFTQYAQLTRKLLQLVAASDVANEVYKANRAILSSARHELIRLLLFTTKSLSHLALTLVVDLRAQQRAAAARAAYEDAITAQYDSLLRGVLTKTVAPILQQGSVVNYMVRASSLCQYAGGLVSLLPRAATAGEAAPATDATSAAVRWLLRDAVRVLPLVTQVLAPLLNIAIKASPFSEKLSSLANQAIHLTQKQLEERRALFMSPAAAVVAPPPPPPATHKRGREEATGGSGNTARKKKKTEEALPPPEEVEEGATLQDALTCLSTGISLVRENKRISTIQKENKKAVKRRRHEELKGQQAME
ncbi:hypothetical protein STCU_11192 [Strigomonas culicis]|uniref:Uncharacterized protein n=1 Tax=Strigomonas culicis TaxID=28005 RepID=S9TEM5_9TRYP|nr:hypothetical protein STCU_11192 [Strigomonas culicis]|eukprot:EPY16497.1 hypothetical protein STCU_11192 [Strigomonas culicis]